MKTPIEIVGLKNIMVNPSHRRRHRLTSADCRDIAAETLNTSTRAAVATATERYMLQVRTRPLGRVTGRPSSCQRRSRSSVHCAARQMPNDVLLRGNEWSKEPASTIEQDPFEEVDSFTRSRSRIEAS